MMKRVMVTKYGFIDLDAKTDEEAIEKAKNLQDSDFDWSDFDEPKVIDDLDVAMKQIIKFVDSDVDGCGTNVEMLIQIEGKNPLSTELVDALKHTIHEYIDSNAGEWSTDDVVNQACEYLESQGYMCDYIGEDLLIEF